MHTPRRRCESAATTHICQTSGRKRNAGAKDEEWEWNKRKEKRKKNETIQCKGQKVYKLNECVRQMVTVFHSSLVSDTWTVCEETRIDQFYTVCSFSGHVVCASQQISCAFFIAAQVFFFLFSFCARLICDNYNYKIYKKWKWKNTLCRHIAAQPTVASHNDGATWLSAVGVVEF